MAATLWAQRACHVLAVFLLSLCLCRQGTAASLPAGLGEMFGRAGIPLSDVSLLVQRVGDSRPLLTWNADVPRSPASTMKLLTSFSALTLLGPDYRWPTEVWLDGELANGVLKGNVMLKGSGDPALTLEQFWLLVGELRSRGVTDIRGDLVLDKSAFPVPPGDPFAFDGDGVRAYNTLPDALLVNFNAVQLRLQVLDDKVQVRADPPLFAAIHNFVRLVTPCSGCQKSCDDVSVRLMPGNILELDGRYSVACGETSFPVNVYGQTDYLASLFRLLWKESGGQFAGQVVEGVVPAGASRLFVHQSAPLAQLMRDMNKFSNNVQARLFFLTIGAQRGTGGPLLPAAAMAIRSQLDALGIQAPGLVLDNGSGLSRQERIAPRTLADLLLRAQTMPYGPEFMSSLPIAGLDGTVRRRFQGTPAQERAHVKTGSVAGVRAVAGYVPDRDGRLQVFVGVINHPNAPAGVAALDRMVDWAASLHD